MKQTVESMLALGKKPEKFLTEEIKRLCSVQCLLLTWHLMLPHLTTAHMAHLTTEWIQAQGG